MTLDHSITSTADIALWETGSTDIIMIYANPFNVNVNNLLETRNNKVNHVGAE